jgi:hypothetical protein
LRVGHNLAFSFFPDDFFGWRMEMNQTSAWRRFRVRWVAPVLVAAVMPAAAQASGGLNILWYGDSFINTVQVPYIFQDVAVAAGKASPFIGNPSVDGETLQWEIANNEGPITTDLPAGQTWNYVVEQEYSTRPTNISPTLFPSQLGNPAQFISDTKTLYNDVKTKSNSPNVKPILMETWSRSLSNSSLSSWYPSPTYPTQLSRATEMQTELHNYYNQAQANIGSVAQVSPVGNAFQADNWDNSLYQSDFYHEDNEGGLLASLVLYQTIYGANSTLISYSAMNSQLTGGLAAYGISNTTQWSQFTTLAESVVPEPGSVFLVSIGALLSLRRRRASGNS